MYFLWDFRYCGKPPREITRFEEVAPPRRSGRSRRRPPPEALPPPGSAAFSPGLCRPHPLGAGRAMADSRSATCRSVQQSPSPPSNTSSLFSRFRALAIPAARKSTVSRNTRSTSPLPVIRQKSAVGSLQSRSMIQFFQHLRRTNVQLQAATAAAPAGTATGADGDMAQPQGPSSPAPAQLPAAEDRAAHPVPQADKQHVPAVPGPAEQALHQQSALAGVLQEYREAVPLPDCRTHGFRGTHLLPAGRQAGPPPSRWPVHQPSRTASCPTA